jgi:hypothetical protein
MQSGMIYNAHQPGDHTTDLRPTLENRRAKKYGQQEFFGR